jgi:hypothetical protein
LSRSALTRIADEVCLQMHLLNLGFRRAVGKRSSADDERTVAQRQLVGHAGIAAERLHRALGLPASSGTALRVLELHPLLNPLGYVEAVVNADVLSVSQSPAHDDGAWITLCGPSFPEPLQAAVRAIDPRLDVEISGTDTDWSLVVVQRAEAQPEMDEVALTRFSTGTTFSFEPRTSLPLTVL